MRHLLIGALLLVISCAYAQKVYIGAQTVYGMPLIMGFQAGFTEKKFEIGPLVTVGGTVTPDYQIYGGSLGIVKHFSNKGFVYGGVAVQNKRFLDHYDRIEYTDINGHEGVRYEPRYSIKQGIGAQIAGMFESKRIVVNGYLEAGTAAFLSDVMVQVRLWKPFYFGIRHHSISGVGTRAACRLKALEERFAFEVFSEVNNAFKANSDFCFLFGLGLNFKFRPTKGTKTIIN